MRRDPDRIGFDRVSTGAHSQSELHGLPGNGIQRIINNDGFVGKNVAPMSQPGAPFFVGKIQYKFHITKCVLLAGKHSAETVSLFAQ